MNSQVEGAFISKGEGNGAVSVKISSSNQGMLW
jgi:hypothetical protein